MRSLLLGAIAFVRVVSAIGHDPCVAFTKSSAFSFPLSTSTLFVDSNDWPGVRRVVQDFSTDVGRVTGRALTVVNASSTAQVARPQGGSSSLFIVGTLGHSAVIDAIVSANSTLNVTVAGLEGKWEAYAAQLVTLPGIGEAYVLIGSDKRGTIYGLYELSEQIGVSPWYWWADVPVKKNKNLYLTSCSHGSPDVKYRGIFLNDEQPALQSWAQEKFTNGTGAPFNHLFYGHVFELILRLRGNYLWPAMWGAMFAPNDALNQPLADEYGVVMGTSHQEPMARSTPNEWNAAGWGDWNFTTNAANITKFWTESVQRAKPYETVFTLGMRGSGDLPLEESTNIEHLTEIINAQRQVFQNVYNQSDVSGVPQMWCLYKEVQTYYEHGLRAPEDVILLWADDNWGNIRRLPIENERNRTGGAGVYYHFDYVGSPRDYKWITSTQLSKVYEQMSLAHERGADSMWIVNVGDLKPYELDIEFFITLGYDTSRFSATNLDSYVAKWAAREFDVKPDVATKVAGIVSDLTRWNARRKPELLNSTLFSLTDYREADTVAAQWDDLYKRSSAIYNSLPAGTKPAFFELVHHPVKASWQLGNLYISVGKNNLYASQARLSTNAYADQAEALFEADYDLELEYNSMLDGKWDHFMDQTHINYYYWQQPMQNVLPAINRVQSRKQALAGAMRVAIEGSRGAWPGDNPYQCAQGYNCPPPTLPLLDPYLPHGSRWLDISAGGPSAFGYTVKSNVTWLKLVPSSGSIDPGKKKYDQRVEVSADWSKVDGTGALQTAAIVITATDPKGKQPDLAVTVYVNAKKTSVSSGFKGFVESDGGVSIEASHFSRSVASLDNTSSWAVLPGYGRTLDGITLSPGIGNSNFSVGAGPRVEYDFFTFSSTPSGNVSVSVYVNPSLNANGQTRPLGYAIQVDEGAPQAVYFIPTAAPGTLPSGWDGNEGPLAYNIVVGSSNHTVAPGQHTLKLWGIEQAVVAEKIIINTGGVRTSYLGPPESVRV